MEELNIVVTADTHIPGRGKHLPSKLLTACKTADLIIHAGDFKSIEIYDQLKEYADVVGVYGNVEGEDIKSLLPAKQIIDVFGKKIGVVHGHGEKKTTERRALEAFAEDNVDIIVFGHSHIPFVKYFKKTLLFNPGSPTDKRTLPYYSYGLLQIEEEIKAEIIFFSSKE